jgi:hypothetical protein
VYTHDSKENTAPYLQHRGFQCQCSCLPTHARIQSGTVLTYWRKRATKHAKYIGQDVLNLSTLNKQEKMMKRTRRKIRDEEK